MTDIRRSVRLTALFLAAAFLLASCGSEASARRAEDPIRNAWEGNARALVEGIEAIHPNPWRNASRREVEAAALRAAEPGITEGMRRARIVAALALIGEGHTSSQPWMNRSPRLPLSLRLFPDRVMATAASSASWEISGPEGTETLSGAEGAKAVAGSRVISIGGLPIEAALARLGTYACAETALGRRVEAVRLATNGDALADLGWIAGDGRVELGLELADGRTVAARAAPGYAQGSLAMIQGTEAYRRAGEPLWTCLMRGGSASYLAYNDCSDEAPFDSVIAEFLAASGAEGVSDVIVDLRYNGGGNSWPFTSKVLPELKRLGQSRRLWVLAGTDTFSSAIIALKELRVDAGATFVGSPTVEGYTSYGDIRAVTLPFSDFSFFTSTKLFRLVPGVPEGLSIEPDVLEETGAADFAAGRDTVLERALSGS